MGPPITSSLKPGEVDTRGFNLPIFLVGAAASAFVGSMYGYAYLKDDIKDFWVATGDDVAALEANIHLAGAIGFLGQYIAVIPGLVFDYFGAAITCWYGGILCCMGFVLAGLSVPSPNELSTLLVVGMFLVGQGSKGLGFGSLLGTVKVCADDYASMISGIYLMLDACSSVIIMFFYDLVWKPTFQAGLDPKEDAAVKANSDSMFFIGLGILILAVATIAGLCYMIMLKADVQKEDSDDDVCVDEERGITQEQIKQLGTGSLNPERRSSNLNYRKNRSSNISRRSSLADEATLATFKQLTAEETRSQKAENQPLVGKKEEAKSRIHWTPVLCVFAVLLTGEAAGLAFNAANGESFMAHRRTAFLSDWSSISTSFKGLKQELNTDEAAIRSAIACDQEGVSCEDSAAHGNSLIQISNVLLSAVNNVPSKVFFDYPASNVVFYNENSVLLYTIPITGLQHDTVILKSANDEKTSISIQNADLKPLLATHKIVHEGFKKILSGLKPVAGILVGKEGAESHAHFTSHICSKSSELKTQKTKSECTLGSCGAMKIRKKENNDPSSKSPLSVAVPKPLKHKKDAEEVGAARVNLRMLFDKHSLNHKESAVRGAKGGFTTLEYPMYTDKVKETVHNLPFYAWAQGWEAKSGGKMVLCYKPLGADGKCPADACGGEITVDEKEPFYFDQYSSAKNKINAKGTKRTLTIIYALSNAAGRLSFGFMAAPFDKFSPYFPLSIWFIVGMILNTIVYSIFYLSHPGSFTDISTAEGKEAAPSFLYFLTFLAAYSYGGVFTINTSFMREVVPATKVGVVLGASLVILAIGNLSLQKVEAAVTHASMDEYLVISAHGKEVGVGLKQPFFLMAASLSALALLPAGWVYTMQVSRRKQIEKEEL